MQGVHEPAVQAVRTGLGIDAVRKARRRVQDRARALLAEDAEEGPS